MSSHEFIKNSNINRTGKNTGKRSIWFNGYKMNRETGIKEEYVKERFQKYKADSFVRLLND